MAHLSQVACEAVRLGHMPRGHGVLMQTLDIHRSARRRVILTSATWSHAMVEEPLLPYPSHQPHLLQTPTPICPSASPEHSLHPTPWSILMQMLSCIGVHWYPVGSSPSCGFLPHSCYISQDPMCDLLGYILLSFSIKLLLFLGLQACRPHAWESGFTLPLHAGCPLGYF